MTRKKILYKIGMLLIAMAGVIGFVFFGPWIILIAMIVFTPVLLLGIGYIVWLCASLVINHVRRRKKGQKHLFRDTDMVPGIILSSSDDEFIEGRYNWDEVTETFIKADTK